ncbi:putative di- and tripeptidase DUG2 [Hypsizygus marmoreus]|uniref:Di- and tripeptidase DUG2 n=1 Tax=Hypsizygus marmoreus TaxID=39966 RepID=A0A369J7E8_HYPMA|nr:putative di- and tripeptidase DUG2 [Hypsizygus marmoreus]
MPQSPLSPVPHPSLSRDLQSDESAPALLHSLHQVRSSVLSLAANKEYIFSGSQNQDISVWDKKTFTLKNTLRGHTGSVLALEIAKEKEWLFSSSGDSTIRIWSTVSLTPIYVLDPYLETDAGDLFSLSWSPTLQTIYIGCQNTSLQWYDFREPLSASVSSFTPPTSFSESLASASGTSTPSSQATAMRKVHKFFDSYPQYERKPADIFARNARGGASSPDSDHNLNMPLPQGYLSIPAENVIDSAHYGYIYCMAIFDGGGHSVQLATGSGDETVKLWDCTEKGPVLVHEFECTHGAVLALIARGETIYAGCQDGYVKVLDLETKTLVRTILVQECVDILSMSMINSDLYTCSANGYIKRWSPSFDCTASWKAHSGIVLSSTITPRNGSTNSGFRLITGGNDNYIHVWEITPPRRRPHNTHHGITATDEILPGDGGQQSAIDTMTYALSKFVSIPSISSSPRHTEDCRQAAIWLKKCLAQLGARTSLLPTGEGKNPLVLGTFSGTKGDKPNPRVLFYGHYDVIPAPPDGWESDPFTLTGRNGYLYGRGVTDDKGPIIAAACAAADLLARRALGLDLVFLVEGEEECGSAGFGECVRKHKDLIGDIDAILVSNSTWIGENRPCITYGLRGVVHCTLEISSNLPDLHSGIEGGAVVEPMFDMVQLLATLTDGNRKVRIPGFYDHVRPQTPEEDELYALLSNITQRPASSLSSRWREPSLTLHTIEISGPKNATVIPGLVKSQLSLRIVPDQDLDTIVRALCDHLESSFESLKSPNKLQIKVEHTADWWLGSLDDHWFKALESAVQDVWGVAPLRIREGGSIPSVPYLEKEFGCHALHLPMGQSSDQAHLSNERMSLTNLHKGKLVVEQFLLNIAEKYTPPSSSR